MALLYGCLTAAKIAALRADMAAQRAVDAGIKVWLLM